MDNYEIQSKLGSGNFAKVYLATHKPTGQQVALKLINKSSLSNVKMFQRVHREIKNMKKLGAHESIVSTYETFETREHYAIAMEYLPGGELFDYVLTKGGLPEDTACGLFCDIARAVEHCHENGIAHRDLKLENIILDSNKKPKIADFGFSKESHSCPMFATYCGSPLYTAPEMMHGDKYIGPECDVWSMGVVLYTMLTATMPFDDSNFPKFMIKIQNGSYSPPSGISDAAKDLISKMLDPNPSTRYTIQNVLNHKWLSGTTKDKRKRKVGICQPPQTETPQLVLEFLDCDCSCHSSQPHSQRDSVVTKHCPDCEDVEANPIEKPILNRNQSSTSSGYGSEFGSQLLPAYIPTTLKPHRLFADQTVRRNSLPRKSDLSIPHGRNSIPSSPFVEKPAYSTTCTCSVDSDDDDDETFFI